MCVCVCVRERVCVCACVCVCLCIHTCAVDVYLIGRGVIVPAAVGTITGFGFGLVMIGLIVKMEERTGKGRE